MKKLKFRLLHVLALTACLGMLAASCGKNDEPSDPFDDEEDKEVVESEMKITVCGDLAKGEDCVPRLFVEHGDWLCYEILDPSNPNQMLFHFMNPKEGLSALMSASEEGVFIYEVSPFYERSRYDVTSIIPQDEGYVVSTGVYDAVSDQFKISTSQTVKMDGMADAPETTRSGDPFDDSVRRLVVDKILNPLSEKMNDVDYVLGKLPFTAPSRMVLKIWSNFGIPIIKAQLYSDTPEQFATYLGENVFTCEVNEVINQIKVMTWDVSDWKMLGRLCLAAYRAQRHGAAFDEEEYSSDDEPLFLNLVENHPALARRMQMHNYEIRYGTNAHDIKVQLTALDKRSATLKGFYTNNDGGFTSTGFRLYKNGSLYAQENVTIDGYASYTFGGLEKGTEYIATAYANVMGTCYESSPVWFRIEGDLSLSSNKVTFGEDGGSEKITVTLPSDKWTWNAVASDPWCELVTSGNRFLVKVGGTGEARSTVVTVTAKSPTGEIQSQLLTVKQRVTGDRMKFKGLCQKYYRSGSSGTEREDGTEMYELVLEKKGRDYALTCEFPHCHLFLENWTVSNNAPTAMLHDASFKDFSASTKDRKISVSGSVRSYDGRLEGEFSLVIDLSTLTAEYYDHRDWDLSPLGVHSYTTRGILGISYDGDDDDD